MLINRLNISFLVFLQAYQRYGEPPAHRSGRRLGPPGSASARTWSRAGCWFVALRGNNHAPCPRQRAAPRSIACPTTVVPRHSRQPRARLAARGGPGPERDAAQARVKGVGLLRVAAPGRWRACGFRRCAEPRPGESGPRMGHAFACHRANEGGIAAQRQTLGRGAVNDTVKSPAVS